MPPTLVPLSQSEMGQEPMQKRFRWPIQLSPIAWLINMLSPVQEMAPFQRVIVDLEFETATVAGAGEFVTFAVTVPVDETWILKAAQIRHTAPGGAKTWEMNIDRANPTQSTLVLVRTTIIADDTFYNMLSRKQLATAASSGHFDKPDGPIELYEGDILLLRTPASFTGAASANAGIRYEVVPKIRIRKIRSDGVTTVV